MDDLAQQPDDRWRLRAEHLIQDAIQAGEFDNLPGAGRPVAVDENPFVPEEWRVAFKVLANARAIPSWIALGNEIDADLGAWRAAADRHFAYLRAGLADAVASPLGVRRLREAVAALKAAHARATEQHAATIAAINSKILYFNATVPSDGLLRPVLDREREMRIWADRLPAYLAYEPARGSTSRGLDGAAQS